MLTITLTIFVAGLVLWAKYRYSEATGNYAGSDAIMWVLTIVLLAVTFGVGTGYADAMDAHIIDAIIAGLNHG